MRLVQYFIIKLIMQITPNAAITNKFAPGDRLFVVFNIGPDIKINQFKIEGMVAEFITDKPNYLYAYKTDGAGREGGVNLSWSREDMCFFDRKRAEKKAVQMVGDLLGEYKGEIEKVQAEFEKKMTSLKTEMGKINAKHLDVLPNELIEPMTDEDEAVAEMAGHTEPESETKINEESNGENQTETVPDKAEQPTD
jgi:hypothetical protein